LAVAVDLDEVAAGRDGVGEGRRVVERAAELVEVRDRDFRAATDGARVRLELAQDHLEQGRLAGSIGPDEADLVAAHDARGKIPYDVAIAIALGDMLELGHELAGALALRHRQLDAPHAIASRCTLCTQG